MPLEKAEKKARRIDIPTGQIKVLFVASAGQCAFPECIVRGLVGATAEDDPTVITEAAHIHAYEDDGPRADATMSLKERNRYGNLVVLCPTHHTTVDKQPKHYTVEMLRQWKSTTEALIQQAIQQVMPSVTFHELELVTRSVLAEAGSVSSDFGQTPPVEKMKKNGLSQMSQNLLLAAIGQAKYVYEFVQKFTISDAAFASRLRAGFVDRYAFLRAQGLEGDELFTELQLFACGGRAGLKWQAVGLAVLGYFFEACEVFEK